MIQEITSFSNSSFRSPRETGKEKLDKNSANVKSANVDENFLDSMESLCSTDHKTSLRIISAWPVLITHILQSAVGLVM